MVSNVFTLTTTAGSTDDNGNVMAILRDARVTREDASRHSLRNNPEDDQSEPEDDHSDRKALLKIALEMSLKHPEAVLSLTLVSAGSGQTNEGVQH